MQKSVRSVLSAFTSLTLVMQGFFVALPLHPAQALVAGGYIDSSIKINHTTTNGPVFLPDILVTYGANAGTIGDLNDDGVDDLLVGATLYDGGGTNRGAALVHFMNTDGTMDATARISDNTANGPVLGDNNAYGACVNGIGDLNDDGVEDMIVGAPNNATGGTGRGAAFISFLNTDGSVDSTVTIASGTANGPVLADNSLYGTGCVGLGDLNGDGVEDIAVSAAEEDTGGSNRGAVFVHYLNTDGSIDSTVKIASGTANLASIGDGYLFGSGLANAGDVNGDGVTDLAVGARNAVGAAGALYVLLMNTDGSLDASTFIDNSTANGPLHSSGDRFGISVAALGDWNEDGVVDIGVGAYLSDIGGTNRGAAYLLMMNADGTVSETYRVDDDTVNGPTLADGHTYGSGIASLDLDEDGKRELVVGAMGDTSQRGAIYIHTMREVVPTTDNAVTLGRLKAGASGTFSVTFDLADPLTGQLKVTFPAGFTVNSAATSGSCSGGGTLGTFGFTASTLTAQKTGCSGTVTMSGANVTNPGTPGTYVITWTNDDPGEATVYISSEDQINVTANVYPYVTFALHASTDACLHGADGAVDDYTPTSGSTVSFGVISPTAVASSDGSGSTGTNEHICTVVSTNAAGGYNLSVRSLNGGLYDGAQYINSNGTETPFTGTGLAAQTAAGGIERYGICLSSVAGEINMDASLPVGYDLTASGNYGTGGSCTGASAGLVPLSTDTNVIGSNTGPVQDGVATWRLKASVSAVTGAGNYNDTLTFVATGTF